MGSQFDAQIEAPIADIFGIFGEEATFTPSTGSPISGIKVIYEQQPGIQGLTDSGVMRIEPTIEYLLSDIGREVLAGETFTIDSAVYTVCETVSNDGYSGIVTVKI